MDEHADTISDSSKQVDSSNEPITDTHIVEGINNLSVEVVSVDPTVIGVGIIGQGVINRRGRNIVMNILTDSSKQLFETNRFQFNSLQSDTLVIGTQDKSVKITNKIIRVNCGVKDGSWITCHGLIKYGTHKHVTYVVMS